MTIDFMLSLGSTLGVTKVPGKGFLYTKLAQGVSTIFAHFFKNLPTIHCVHVFTYVKYLAMNTILNRELFLFSRVGTRKEKMYVRMSLLHTRNQLHPHDCMGCGHHFLQK